MEMTNVQVQARGESGNSTNVINNDVIERISAHAKKTLYLDTFVTSDLRATTYCATITVIAAPPGVQARAISTSLPKKIAIHSNAILQMTRPIPTLYPMRIFSP